MKYQVEFEHKNKDFEDVWKIEHEYLEPSTIAGIDKQLNGITKIQISYIHSIKS